MIKNRPESPDIRASIDREAERLLGRHVGHLADSLRVGVARQTELRLRNAEVDNFAIPLPEMRMFDGLMSR